MLLGLHLPRQRQIGILSEEWHRAKGVELTSARVHPTFFGLGRFWIFAFRPEFCVRRLQSGLERFSMGRSGGNFGRPENGGRRAAKARGRSGALSRVTFQKFCRRRAGLDPGRGRADGMHGLDQGAAERRSGRSSDRHSRACSKPSQPASAPARPSRTKCNAISIEARIADRIRRRGKRLQAHRRQPIQKGGMPPVESGCQRPARRKGCLETTASPK